MTPAAPEPEQDELAVVYFDGRTARARPARVKREGSTLRIEPLDDGPPRVSALAGVRWSERQRHGPRHADLPEGGRLQADDPAAWDAWVTRHGQRDAWVVRAQQSWRGTVLAGVTLVGLALAGYLWGLPWAARTSVAMLPASVDRSVGELSLASLREQGVLTPSAIAPATQTRLRRRFADAVAAAFAPADRPAYDLLFHASRIGPNALALPGGSIVLTDPIVTMFEDDEAVLVGVLAHELGHVRARHGMRAVVQVALLGTATSLAFGDFSTLVAGGAALVGQMAYSRDFEREADDEAIRILRAAGIDPAVMARLFERLAQARRDRVGPELGIALASHPADAERIARFRAAGRAR